MLSCTKSDFMHKLEGLLTEKTTSIQDTVDTLIFDGHAIIQSLTPGVSTPMVSFKSMASWFYSYINRCVKSMKTSEHFQIHVIFDKYYEDSVKSKKTAEVA